MDSRQRAEQCVNPGGCVRKNLNYQYLLLASGSDGRANAISSTEMPNMAFRPRSAVSQPAKQTLSSWSTFELIPWNALLLERAVEKLIRRGRQRLQKCSPVKALRVGTNITVR